MHAGPRQAAWWRRPLARLGLVVLCLLLGACTLLRSRSDTQVYQTSTILVGRVQAHDGLVGPVVVAAYVTAFGRFELAHAVLLHEPGAFELVVPNGAYRLLAFHDANGNATLDAGEPCAPYRGHAQSSLPGGLQVFEIELASTENTCALPDGTRFTPHDTHSMHSTQAGTIARLDDALYSSERGRDGYWTPAAFMRSVGGNIVFFEPYDPGKIPMLFVHGAAGSPQDWRYFIEHLDRSRYQPWVFHYPSGAALETSADLLYWKLANLQAKLRLPTLAVTAHSMGGLVVRRMLVSHGAQLPAVKLFLSLSTPWGGAASAQTGVEYSPAVVPSWVDLVPEGDFLRSLFASRLPAGVEHHLYFGHGGRGGLLRQASDGTVSLASQLNWPAQAEATAVRGFDEDHDSILVSPVVMRQYRTVLDTFWRTTRPARDMPPEASLQRGANSIRFRPGSALAPA